MRPRQLRSSLKRSLMSLCTNMVFGQCSPAFSKRSSYLTFRPSTPISTRCASLESKLNSLSQFQLISLVLVNLRMYTLLILKHTSFNTTLSRTLSRLAIIGGLSKLVSPFMSWVEIRSRLSALSLCSPQMDSLSALAKHL